MSRYYGVPHFVLLVLISLGLVGCMSAASPATPPLLEQDYIALADAELIAYEQGLSDEIVSSSQSSNSGVSVGIGFGSWGNSQGYGVGADRQLGDTASSDEKLELRARRDEVRAEMRRRGLLPP